MPKKDKEYDKINHADYISQNSCNHCINSTALKYPFLSCYYRLIPVDMFQSCTKFEKAEA